MKSVTLQELLEAGCHFGHKSERWHPRATEFIYTEKDGIHIIDLAKTKAGLEAAMVFIRDTIATGGQVLFVGTKRQARGVVREEVVEVGAPYFVERWIGGFLTNWDAVKKNIEKINRMAEDEAKGGWKTRPKHEQFKLARYLKRLKLFYAGVLNLTKIPQALVVVDVKKEDVAVREAKRSGIPVIGIVDSNSDPRGIDYIIPANDDAVGSVKLLIHMLAVAYAEGKIQKEKKEETEAKKLEKKEAPQEEKKAEPQEVKVAGPVVPAQIQMTPTKATDIKAQPDQKPASPKGKRGRPKKVNPNV